MSVTRWLFLILLIPSFSHAAIRLPKGMRAEHRRTLLETLGFAMSEKLLSDPYPLGGYSGFEVGVAIESVPLQELQQISRNVKQTQPTVTALEAQPDVTYPKVSLAKGLYNNLDIFVNFAPYSQRTEISQFGALVRWGFYQGILIPASLSFLFHGNTTNINNQLSMTTYGADLVGGINVSNVSLFLGGGTLTTSGVFLGGPTGIIENPDPAVYDSVKSSAQVTEQVTGTRAFGGASIRIANAFFTVQMDRTTITTYSGKVGLRF